MLVQKYTIDGKSSGQVELSDSGCSLQEVNDLLVYEYIRRRMQTCAPGTHKTKERSDVRGGGIKPWRQKGTGRARQGSFRAPQWKSGGTVFGPRPRDYLIEASQKDASGCVPFNPDNQSS
jgi:large subunit ribosomal protein L4